MIGNAAKVPEKGEGQLTIKNGVKGVLFFGSFGGGWELRKRILFFSFKAVCSLLCGFSPFLIHLLAVFGGVELVKFPDSGCVESDRLACLISFDHHHCWVCFMLVGIDSPSSSHIRTI